MEVVRYNLEGMRSSVGNVKERYIYVLTGDI